MYNIKFIKFNSEVGELRQGMELLIKVSEQIIIPFCKDVCRQNEFKPFFLVWTERDISIALISKK